ncbi:MAG: RNA pseudouridine synthase [Burkholderiaceae bacterium]
MTEPVRLSKRLSDMVGCSRREAELYIEGGWVRVDGQVVEVPQLKVDAQTVELDPKARLEPVAAVTLLLHKPPGLDWDQSSTPARQLLRPQNHWSGDHHAPRLLQRHLNVQSSITPLETDASGLLVFTQDWRVERKLVQDAALVEHELIVDVTGKVTPEQLLQLNRAPVIDGRAMLPARVSVSRQSGDATGLRFAVKGHRPGQIAQMCAAAHLKLTAIKRIRVGRIAMATLALGQWRYLAPFERF